MSDCVTLTPPPPALACVNLNLVVFLLGSLPSEGPCSVNVDGKLRVFTTVERGMMPPLPPPPLCPPLCVCSLHHYCHSAHLCWNSAWTVCTEDH